MAGFIPTNTNYPTAKPLNCFAGDDFDLAKISGPFTLATDGKFTVSITNIRLEKLAEGEKGCVGEKKE